MNYYSFIAHKFKITTIYTLLHRAFEISSSYLLMQEEFDFLKKFFCDNNCPPNIINEVIYKFFNKKYSPSSMIPTVPKEIIFIRLSYLGFLTNSFHCQLTFLLKKFFTASEFKISYVNNYSIGSLFKIKDPMPTLLRSGVVYMFSCPRCTRGVYIGSTLRLLGVRVAGHRGVSHRTHLPLKNKELSTIREHVSVCGGKMSDSDFAILDSATSETSLRILEYIYIKRKRPFLNSDTSSVPLLVS